MNKKCDLRLPEIFRKDGTREERTATELPVTAASSGSSRGSPKSPGVTEEKQSQPVALAQSLHACVTAPAAPRGPLLPFPALYW